MGWAVRRFITNISAKSDLCSHSERVVLVDADDRIIGALAGAPRDQEDFKEVISEVEALLDVTAPTVKARTCGPCKDKVWDDQCRKCRQRRGKFSTLSIGISYGGGQTVSNLYSSCSTQAQHLHHLRNPTTLNSLAEIKPRFTTY